MAASASSAPPALLGQSIGGLAGVKLRFRPQLFWQEVLPEQCVASRHLQFHFDMTSGRNFARLPSDTEYDPDGEYASSMARAVPDADADPAAQHVGRALREAAAFQDSVAPLRHLLTSCYCTKGNLADALCEAARQGSVDGVALLLRAGADPHATPQGKTALHVAVEEGCEAAARAIISSDPSTLTDVCHGCTAVERARQRDLGLLARRLEAHGKEATQAAFESEGWREVT